jgi:two-component system, response regulator / RNA-binding antiterminator
MINNKLLLLVDSIDENTAELQQSLQSIDYQNHQLINIKKTIEINAHNGDFSIIICQFRHVKDSYLNVIAELVKETPKPIILFTRDDSRTTIDKSVKIGVNAYIIDGFDTQRLGSIIKVAISRFESYQKIVHELTKTRQQLEDRKLIDKAKGLLMKNKNMDEQQAYKMIRKISMDKGKTMGEISRSIIELIDIL